MSQRAWEASYKGHTIRVEVEEKLFAVKGALLVDGQVQDQSAGMAMRSSLKGGVGSENVVARLGGLWRINCRLQVAGAELDAREVGRSPS